MKVVIAGGSGFVGQELTNLLLQQQYEVIVLTRKQKSDTNTIRYVQWLQEGTQPAKEIGSADVIINLAGVSINNGRWDTEHQKAIYTSRMDATKELLSIVDQLDNKPTTWINASAIGIYPASVHTVYTEQSVTPARDFLGRTVYDWEKTAQQVEKYGVRTVFTRFGVILGKEEGALPLMTLPYRLFAGGKVGSGEQWVSWVHVTDVARAILFTIENDTISGPVNVTAPAPKRMKYFGKTIGNVLQRPHWLPVPSFAMKIALGKKSELVLTGQHVQPEVLLENGFVFSYPSLDNALRHIYSHNK